LVAVACFLPGRAKNLSAAPCTTTTTTTTTPILLLLPPPPVYLMT